MNTYLLFKEGFWNVWSLFENIFNIVVIQNIVQSFIVVKLFQTLLNNRDIHYVMTKQLLFFKDSKYQVVSHSFPVSKALLLN